MWAHVSPRSSEVTYLWYILSERNIITLFKLSPLPHNSTEIEAFHLQFWGSHQINTWSSEEHQDILLAVEA